jgi:hypothetical protein
MSPNGVTASSHTLNVSLAVTCLLLAIALPALTIHFLAVVPPAVAAEKLGLAMLLAPTATPFELSGGQRALMMVIGVLPPACMAYGLWCARRVFLSFARAEYFSAAAVDSLKRFSGAVFLAGVLGLVVPPLLGLLLTLTTPGAKTSLSFKLGSNEVLLILFAGLVRQIAAGMTRAAAIAEDHAQIV